MIDNIQGLGIDFHFLHEIDQILHIVYKKFNQNKGCYDRDLREVALCFRLLRQEGHNVQESTRYNALKFYIYLLRFASMIYAYLWLQCF